MFEILNQNTNEVIRPEKKRISIGCSDACDIVVEHPDVSPTQVFLTKTKLGYFLMNFHPDHVVTVNEEPVKEKMLKPGDRFRLGDVTFSIQKTSDPAAETAAAPDAMEKPPADVPEPVAVEEPPQPPVEEPAFPDSPAPAEVAVPEEPAPEEPAPEEPAQEPVTEEAFYDSPAPAEEPAPAQEVAAAEPAQEPAGDIAPWDVPVDDIPEKEEEPEAFSLEEARDFLGEPTAEEAPEKAPEEAPQPIPLDNIDAMFEAEKDKMGEVSAEEPALRFKLHVAIPDVETRVVDVVQPVTIGRESDNVIELSVRTVSRYHARIFLDGDGLKLVDLQSSMGVKVNGKKMPWAMLQGGDIVLVGNATITVEDVGRSADELPSRKAAPPQKTKVAVTPMLMVMGGNLDGKLFPIITGLTIGSDDDNDIVLKAEGVTSHHARIETLDGKLQISDLSGGAGIRVNGAIVENEELAKGDAVEVADVLLLVRETVTRVPDDSPTPEEPEPATKKLAEAPGSDKPNEQTPPLGIAPLAIDDEKPASGWPPSSLEEAAFSLVIVGGIMDGKTFPVSGDVTVGREGDNTIVLLDSTVSRGHAKMSPRPDGVFLADLGSATGVFVNEERVSDRLLTAGDTVRIGNTRMVLKPIAETVKEVNDGETLGAPTIGKAVCQVPPDGKVSSDHPSLLMLRGKEKGSQFELLSDFCIGRNEDADITVDHSEASGRHTDFFRDNERWVMRDLGSTNGTWLNGTKIEEVYVRHGDIIEVAYHEFLFREPGRPTAPSGRKAPSVVIRAKGAVREKRQRLAASLYIGRDKRNIICLDNPLVSGEHARIFNEGRHYFIEDLGSTNGTWVKGQKISHKVMLEHGDPIFIGETIITFKEPDRPLKTGAPLKKSTMMLLGVIVLVMVSLSVVVVIFKDKFFPPPKHIDDTTPVENLLALNSGFESALDGKPLANWKSSDPSDVEVVKGQAFEGTYALLLGKSADRPDREVVVVYERTFPVDSNWMVYRISAQFKSEEDQGITGFRVRWMDENGRPVYPDSYSRFQPLSREYQLVSDSFLPPARPTDAAALKLGVAVYSAGMTGRVWCDDVRLEAIPWKDMAPEEQSLILKWPLVESDEFRIRCNERGIFRVTPKGDDRPTLWDAELRLTKRAGRVYRQGVCDLNNGYPDENEGAWTIRGEMTDMDGDISPAFSQILQKTEDQKYVRVRYFLENVQGALALVFRATTGPIILYDEDVRSWKFEGAFPRKNNVVEIVLRRGGKTFSINFTPPCAVEARSDGANLAFLLHPAFPGEARKFEVMFYDRPVQVQNRLDDLVAMAAKYEERNEMGRAFASYEDLLKDYPEFADRVKEWNARLAAIRGAFDRRFDDLTSRWNDFKAGIAGQADRNRTRERIQDFSSQAKALFTDFSGCDLALEANELHKEIQAVLRRYMQADIKAEFDRYVNPLAKALASGNYILAAIYYRTLEASGNLDLFPEDMAARIAEMKRSLDALQGEPSALAALKEKAEKFEKSNELEKALAIWQEIARNYVDRSDTPDAPSETAMEASRKIRELTKKIR
jgi:pSer/pThr/pTyr-binding forkhead associated (FHA) protein